MHDRVRNLACVRRACTVLGITMLVGCAASTETDPSPQGAFTLTLSAAPGDTIEARLQTPLTVTLVGSDGTPAADLSIRVSNPKPPAQIVPTVRLGLLPETATDSALTLKTDGTGKVVVWLRLGRVSGTHYVKVALDRRPDVVDSVAFEVRPGNQVGPGSAAPGDSALYVDNSYQLRPAAEDRAGNPVAVIYSSRNSSIAEVDGSGVVTGKSTGRTYILTQFPNRLDSVALSVVPQGVIAAHSDGPLPGLYLFNLDGSNVRRVSTEASTGRNPKWSPDGTRIATHGAADFGRAVLSLFTPEGAVTRVMPTRITLSETQPQFSADGEWIYYSGLVNDAASINEIWRVRPNGTDASRIGPANTVLTDLSPSPSRDGTLIAYATNKPNASALRILVLNLQNGQTDTLTEFGARPRWSPTRDELAFFSSEKVWLINADGTGLSSLAPSLSYADQSVDWSPDGNFLVVCVDFNQTRRLVIVDRSTRQALPLAFTGAYRFCEAGWKP